jgi:DNA-binding MurR/RpiR family transcriptional regulator
MDIMERIKGEYDGQSALRKKISDFIMDNLLQACFFSLKEFASANEVTEATVLSYGRSIGCDSYLQMKKELQNQAMKSFSSQSRLSVLAKQSSSFDDLFLKVETAEIKSLRAMFEYNSPQKIRAILALLKRAHDIYAVGHCESRIFSDYFSRRMNSLGCSCEALDLQDISLSLSKISSIAASDSLLVAITITPYGKPTLSMARLCKSIGMPVIAITDSQYSPIVADCDEFLLVSTELFGLTNSPTSVFALINLISILMQFDLQKEEHAQQDLQPDILARRYDDILNTLN